MNAGFIGIDVTVTRLNSTTNVVTATNPAFPISTGRLTADVLIVAGGGGGGIGHAGGGGGGGARLIQGVNIAPSAGSTIPITVGGGGAGAPSPGGPPNGFTFSGRRGTDSTALGFTSTGGGGGPYGGGVTPAPLQPRIYGGSGGGSAGPGSGNAGGFSPPEGANGSADDRVWAEGGGGGGGDAGVAGTAASGSPDSPASPGLIGGTGGAGTNYGPFFPGISFGSPTGHVSGGGGGSTHQAGTQGSGGTGGGAPGSSSSGSPVMNATANTGGGAGSFFNSPGSAGTGGSGVVVLKQNAVFSASGVWPLSQVYEQTQNNNWGQPT